MSYIGSLSNSMTAYRSSEENAVIHRNMFHLRNNSGNRSPHRIESEKMAIKKPKQNRNHSTAERVLQMRFPNLPKSEKPVNEIREESEPEDMKERTTMQLNQTAKVFIPNNPRQARKLIERNIFLNNTQDINTDLTNESKVLPSKILGSQHLSKTGNSKFVPNTRQPTHIKNSSGFINSTNGFETFLRKKDEIPRLSILENYRQISKIMRNSFLRAKDIEQRFKNNALSQDELKKKREEEENTKKLTKILKQMNSPRNAFATSEGTKI
jgi:hypothetical protein